MRTGILSRPRRWNAYSRTIRKPSRGRRRSSTAASSRLEELTYQYPEEAIIPGKSAQESLEHLRLGMHSEQVSGRPAARRP